MPLLQNPNITDIYNEIKLKISKIERSNRNAKNVLDKMEGLREGYNPYNLEEL